MKYQTLGWWKSVFPQIMRKHLKECQVHHRQLPTLFLEPHQASGKCWKASMCTQKIIQSDDWALIVAKTFASAVRRMVLPHKQNHSTMIISLTHKPLKLKVKPNVNSSFFSLFCWFSIWMLLKIYSLVWSSSCAYPINTITKHDDVWESGSKTRGDLVSLCKIIKSIKSI